MTAMTTQQGQRRFDVPRIIIILLLLFVVALFHSKQLQKRKRKTFSLVSIVPFKHCALFFLFLARFWICQILHLCCYCCCCGTICWSVVFNYPWNMLPVIILWLQQRQCCKLNYCKGRQQWRNGVFFSILMLSLLLPLLCHSIDSIKAFDEIVPPAKKKLRSLRCPPLLLLPLLLLPLSFQYYYSLQRHCTTSENGLGLTQIFVSGASMASLLRDIPVSWSNKVLHASFSTFNGVQVL